MALHPPFSVFLFRYIRRQRNPVSFFRGRVVLDGAVGCRLASVAGRIREGKLGLSPLRSRVRSGRLAAPDGLPADRAGTVRGALGQHSRARTHVSAAGAPQKKGRDPALGRSRGGFSSQIHSLADPRGRPLCVGLAGSQCHDSTQARTLVEA